MKKIEIDLKNIRLDDIKLIVDYLNSGKIVVLPTDTVYGLHADATNEKALEKIYKIKQRDIGMSFLTLMKSWCMVKRYAYLNVKQDKYMRSLWPSSSKVLINNYKLKPTTAILKSRDCLPQRIASKGNKIAVRIPDNKFLNKILKKLDKPIVSTSLNISGGEQVENLEEIDKVFKIKPDLIVGAGKLKKKKLSKLIDISDIDNVKVIRG